MRHEQDSIGELEVDTIIGGGVNSLVRKTAFLDPTNGSDGNRGLSISNAKKTLAEARKLITTNKNDRIVLVQGTSGISLAADPLWTENMCSLVGSSQGMQGQRARIGMSVDYEPMLTIGVLSPNSGYGNLFANLYLQQGLGAVHVNAVGTLVNGNYNTFRRVHWNAPLSTTLCAEADFVAVQVVGTGFQLFEECTIGGLGYARTGANSNVVLGTGTNVLFRNCIFLAYLGDTAPYFVKVLNTSGRTQAWFENCKFIAMSENMNATLMAEAFKFTGGATCAMFFDNDCVFYHVTKITADASKPYCYLPAYAASEKMIGVILT